MLRFLYKRFRYISSLTVFTLLFLLTAPFFQNCGGGERAIPNGFRTAEFSNSNTDGSARKTPEDSRSTGGGAAGGAPTPVAGGQGYDGKVYQHVMASGACIDGTNIDMAITFRSAVAYLIRNNCAPIPLAQQPTVVAYVNPLDPKGIIYNQLEFVAVPAFFWAQGTTVIAGSGLVCLNTNAVIVGGVINVGNPCNVYESPGVLSQVGNKPVRTVFDFTNVNIESQDPTSTCFRSATVQGYRCQGP